MTKIHQIDQVLFAEQEKKTMTTEVGILKDRWLKAYRWYVAMADNENMKADIRMEARRDAVDMALALLKVESEGPKVIEQGGLELLEKLYLNSRQPIGDILRSCINAGSRITEPSET
jgi:hypothetical protein